jgi:hypothetical protein
MIWANLILVTKYVEAERQSEYLFHHSKSLEGLRENVFSPQLSEFY